MKQGEDGMREIKIEEVSKLKLKLCNQQLKKYMKVEKFIIFSKYEIPKINPVYFYKMLTGHYFKFPSSRSIRRFLNLQEYQSKELMNKYGLITQKFKIISETCEAEKAAIDLSK